jgi:hypothetical protein
MSATENGVRGIGAGNALIRLDTSARFWHVEGNICPDMLGVEFETSWLPVVGPSVMALSRFLTRRLCEDDAFRIEPCELSYVLGVTGAGPSSPFSRVFKRAEYYGFIRVIRPDAFVVIRQFPRPQESDTHRQQRRLAWINKAQSRAAR